MIQDTAWIQEGEWGDENTPDIRETVENVAVDYRRGLYWGREEITE